MTVVEGVLAAVAVVVPLHLGPWVDVTIHTQSVHSGHCFQLPQARVASSSCSGLTACAATANRCHSQLNRILEAVVANSIHPMAPPHSHMQPAMAHVAKCLERQALPLAVSDIPAIRAMAIARQALPLAVRNILAICAMAKSRQALPLAVRTILAIRASPANTAMPIPR